MAFVQFPAIPLSSSRSRAFVCTRAPANLRTLRMSLGQGARAPTFNMPATGGRTVSTTDLSTGIAVLYFYPRDATPGCTIEAKDFGDMQEELTQLGVNVFAVSKDNMESHEAFAKDLGVQFPLVVDDGDLCETFGVWKLRKMGDKEFMGIERSTFLFKDGVVVKEWRGMKAAGHAAEVLKAIKEM